MQIPVQITFHGIDHSDAVDQLIRDKALKLDQLYERIVSCRVVIEAPHRNLNQIKRRGDSYRIRIVTGVPGGELVCSRDPKEGRAPEDIAVAVREAFDAMARQLSDYAERQRGEVKARPAQ